jgi:phosphoserine phosphatase RsbU/P
MSFNPERPRGVEPEWKQFLSLGERLVQLTSVAEQCELITAAVDTHLDCTSRVWLCSPYYPLPGQPDLETLPSDRAPELVKKTHSTRRPHAREDRSTSKSGSLAQELTLPLITREHLLGVLQVRRKNQRHFRSEDLDYLEGLAAYAALNMEIARQVTIKNWHAEQLALVRSVSLQIASVHDIDQMTQRVTDLIQKTFNYYYVAIFTLQPGQDVLRFRACASAEQVTNPPAGFAIQLGEGITGNVAQTGLELVAPDVQLEPAYHFLSTLPETQSEAVFPLKAENQVIGVLDVQSNILDAFHETDMMVLRALADNIALAIHETNLFQHLQRHNEQVSAVYEISQALTSILDLDALLEEVVGMIHRRFGYPFVHIFTVHPGRRKIIYRMGTGERSVAMRETTIAYDMDAPVGIIPWVVQNGKTRVANNVDKDPLYVASALPPANTRAEMTVPLMLSEEVVGVLDIQSDTPDRFEPADVSLCETLAAGVAVAIRNASLYRSERWRRQVADSFRDVAGLISNNIELEKLLDTILTQIERSLPCEASAIWLVENHDRPEQQPAENGENPRLFLAAVHGTEPENVEEALLVSPDARAWIDRAQTFTQSSIREPNDAYGPLGIALRCPPDYSSISIPLLSGDKNLGVLVLAHRTAGRYGSEARDLTTTFANYAAVAIQNSRLFADAQAQAWISTVLLQVAEAGQTISSVDELTSSMVRLTPLLVGVQKCTVFLWDESQQCYYLKDNYGFELLEKGPRRFNERDMPGFAQLRLLHAPVFLESAAESLQLPEADLPDATLILLPLLAHGSLLGAFLVTHQVTGLLGVRMPLSPQTLSILQGIVHQTALTLENLRLLEARQEESYVTAVMLQVAQAVASQNKLDDILDTIVHLMPILVGIDTCVIYQWDTGLEEFFPAQVHSNVRNEEEVLVSQTYRPGEFELLDRVFQNQPAFCPMGKTDLAADEWPGLYCLNAEEFSTVSRFSNSTWLMGFPLSVKGETVGVLLAKETHGNPAFRERRVEIISGVAQQVALAIQNEHLNEEMVERERIEREFQLAREIQQTFLPNRIPSPNGWEVDARWQTARTVGGDFYDVYRFGKKKLALVIADVSDKGIAAALYMTVTRTLIRANAGGHSASLSPAAVLDRVNNQLAADAQNGMFITAVFGLLDLETGLLTYANAGHNLPILYRAATDQVETLEKGNMALAVIEDIHYTDHTLQLEPGDCLLLYTDGVTENFAPDGDAFGEERLSLVMHAQARNGARRLLDHLNDVLVEFREGDPPSDDVTLLSVMRRPTA